MEEKMGPSRMEAMWERRGLFMGSRGFHIGKFHRVALFFLTESWPLKKLERDLGQDITKSAQLVSLSLDTFAFFFFFSRATKSSPTAAPVSLANEHVRFHNEQIN
jgi:hypothetical protein